MSTPTVPGMPGQPAAPAAQPDPALEPSGLPSGASGDAGPAPALPLPVITAPRGGGAIKGIGEKFGTNPVTGTASMTVPIPLSPGRSGFGPSLSLSYDSGLPHYQNLKRAIIETGVAAALDAEDHVVMTELRRGAVPALDLTVLRIAGETNPECALQGLIRAARAAPRTILATSTVAQLLEASEQQLQQALPPQPLAGAAPVPPGAAAVPGAPPKPKRWTGLGKLFTGISIAGANIAGGIALGAFGGPLAVEVTAGGVLASCASGIGAIAEGVGALRGD
jgi:Salmonella virulence plasmid 65kDa B protein